MRLPYDGQRVKSLAYIYFVFRVTIITKMTNAITAHEMYSKFFKRSSSICSRCSITVVFKRLPVESRGTFLFPARAGQ